jgi:predicted metalloprotease with PDZ domain
MNTTHAKKFFYVINDQFFNSVLTMPTFIKYSGNLANKYWFEMDHGVESEYGAYVDGLLFYRRNLKGQTFRDTIAHELIHHYQHTILKLAEIDDIDWHGETFTPFADLMIAEGYNI